MSKFLHEPYLSPQALSNLRYYKYSSVDLSPVSKYVMVHWWNAAAKPFPSWMAPNLITLTGFAFILINIATLAAYAPDLIGPGPSWVYLTFSLGLFLYQTFDNVDGRQARKTGTSSALGHIFDHTIDSLNCALGGILQAASLSLGNSPMSVMAMMVSCAAMWFSTWEEYHTGTLFLGYFNGPTEGILIACVIHLISGIYGPKIWLTPIHTLPPFRWAPSSVRLNDCVIYIALFSFAFIHVPGCLMNVHKLRRSKSLRFRLTLIQHIPFLIFSTGVFSWVLSPHSSLLTSTSERSRGLINLKFAILITFSFGKLGPRVILAHLTHSSFPRFNFGAFAPLTIGALYVNLASVIGYKTNAKVEGLILNAGILISMLAFLYWAITLCREFCKTLDIWCLTIKPKPKSATNGIIVKPN
ncbi:Choline/ethanolaminephosphotransferase [Rickenella mellea]|uniref:Choline/ethanolaminephosphotransferase n=1 Tax=Rickenella mellea TaxID=50990 RepID=A0A4Y7Q707_9AGAM|nr:Choline/ethanolaminephosphotransferase [Rickenella mellea]